MSVQFQAGRARDNHLPRGGVDGTSCFAGRLKNSGGIAVAEGLVTPEQLRCITEQKEVEKARAAFQKGRKAEDERHSLRDAFMARDIHPEVFQRVSQVVMRAAERGEREVLAIRFSSEYCTDRGRAINNFEPEWPETLTGFAARAFEFYKKELEPNGYKLRAQILDFPGGVPGDIGIFLRW